MSNIRDEFEYRLSLLQSLSVNESQHRLSGFYEWMTEQPEIQLIIEELISDGKAQTLLDDADRYDPPKASSPELVAGVGVLLLKEIHSGEAPFNIANNYGITPDFSTNSIADYLEALLQRFISPAINHIFRQLPEDPSGEIFGTPNANFYPLEITESLAKFKKDYPDARRTAFIMMQFGSTKMHEQIVSGIKDTLKKYGITALRADDKEYYDDLFPNVLTYLHGCGFGIAVFERLEADDFNPNVSLEVGYMRAIRKPVCLLKDKTLNTLQTDLVGKLYKSFDPQDPEESIPHELNRWLVDKEIIA